MNSESIKKILPSRLALWIRKKGIRSIHTIKYLLFYPYNPNSYPPIYIYQMGKVGSMSIYKSLLKQYKGLVIQGHNFRSDNLDKMVQKLHTYTFKEKLPLNVISLTREPVGRAISSFFQNFERDTGMILKKQKLSSERLKNLFLEKHDHDYGLKWFEKNFKRNFDIDVYEQDFPIENGYCIIEKENVRVLIMHSELDDNIKQKIIKDFLGFDEFILKNENVGLAKSYSEIYSRFKAEVSLPANYIEKMCNSKIF